MSRAVETTPWRELTGELTALEEIGRGSQGVVYRAQQRGLERHVAVKVFHGPSDNHARQRVRDEARLLAEISHPHVVAVLGHGLLNGDPAMVMEYIEGVTLAELLQELKSAPGAPTTARMAAILGSEPGAIDVRQSWPRVVAGIFARLARALEAAHVRGVLHRDLKPSNVLLSQRGIPFLTDFGVAANIAPGTTSPAGAESSPPARAGNIAYSAPETLLGMPASVSSDAYALGVMAREALSAAEPYRGMTGGPSGPARIRAIDRGELAPLSRSYPADLRAVLGMATTHAPEERYSTSGDLARDLEAVAEGREVMARQSSSPRQSLRKAVGWARRHPRTAGLSALVVALLVLVPQWIQLARLRAAREVQEAGARAAQHTESALREIDRVMLDVVDDALKDQPLLDQTRAELLGSGVAFARQLTDTLTEDDDPQLRVRLDEMRFEGLRGLVSVESRLGRPDAARAYLDEISSLGLQTDPVRRARTAYLDLQVAVAARDFDAVESKAPGVIEQLEAVGSQSEYLSLMLASAWGALLESSLVQGDAQGAVARGEDAIEATRRWAQAAKSKALASRELGRLLGNFGAALVDAKDFERAQLAVTESMELLGGVSPSSSRDRLMATNWNNQGDILRREGNLPEGIAAEREALALQTKLRRSFPTEQRLRFEASRSRQRIAVALGRMDQDDGSRGSEAEELLRAAVEDLDGMCSSPGATEDSLRLFASVLHTLGMRCSKRSDFEESFTFLDRAWLVYQRIEEAWPGGKAFADLRRDVLFRRAALAMQTRPSEGLEAAELMLATFPDDFRLQMNAALMLALLGKRLRQGEDGLAQAMPVEARALELAAALAKHPEVNATGLLASKQWSALRDDPRFLAIQASVGQ